MSIRPELQQRILEHKDTRLFHLPPLLPGLPHARTIIAYKEVFDGASEPFPDNFNGVRLEAFRATLDAFTTGEELSVAERPRDKPPDTMLARIDPVEHEVWAIRAILPPHGIRCFGRFAAKDTFIALTWAYREDIDREDWPYEIRRCLDAWSGLFDPFQPFKGANLHEYLSEPFNAV